MKARRVVSGDRSRIFDSSELRGVRPVRLVGDMEGDTARRGGAGGKKRGGLETRMDMIAEVRCGLWVVGCCGKQTDTWKKKEIKE